MGSSEQKYESEFSVRRNDSNHRENLCFYSTILVVLLFYPYLLRLNWVRKGFLRYTVCFIKILSKIYRIFLSITILTGFVFLPLIPSQVYAGFFSSILGDQVRAEANPFSQSSDNLSSQNSKLALQANVSSASLFQDKNNNKDSDIDTSADVTIVYNNAMMPALGPSGGKNLDFSPQDTSVYVVRKGDTISQIADIFGISVNTILSANDMKKGDKLHEGDILLILPISGVEHTVTKGQTLNGIAKLYKVDASDIASYNGISTNEKLAIGDKFFIPNADGIKSQENGKPISASNLSKSVASDKQYYVTHPLPDLTGYFVNPVPGYRKSQGIHDRNAIDLAIAKGTPIHAAAAGRVTLARKGYNGGFGNLVIIMHPNGVETLYAHMNEIGITTGDQVRQGQIIGFVGSTGRSTGPHLHFEVHGARNPGVDNSWAN